MGKLVLADVDGTILRHGAEQATPRVVEAVRQMHEQGSVLAPVTSRTAKLMGRLATQLGLRDLSVLDGGATLFDFKAQARDLTLSRWMTPTKTAEVIKAIGKLCDEVYYGEDSTLHTSKGRIADSSPSVFVVYPNEAGNQISRALSQIAGIGMLPPNRYEDSATHSCVQVVNEGVSKQSGAQLLLADPRYAHFAPEDVVVIGDGDPDKELLLLVAGGRRFVVGDNPTLLQVPGAIAVPPASKDGFAVAMERYVLN